MPEILAITDEAWQSLDDRVFRSAWMVCGYMEEDHFLGAKSKEEAAEIHTAAHAKKFLNPFDFGLALSCSVPWTPQMCTRYEWQVEDTPCFASFFVHLYDFFQCLSKIWRVLCCSMLGTKDGINIPRLGWGGPVCCPTLSAHACCCPSHHPPC